MKVKPGFLLRQVAGEIVVVPFGEQSKEHRGMLRLNETGRILWERLEQGAEESDLARALTDTFDVTAERAAQDTAAFLEALRRYDMLESE